MVSHNVGFKNKQKNRMRYQLLALLTGTALFTAPTQANTAYIFSDLGTLGGVQSHAYTINNFADVGAVPEADTWAMLLAGLGLVGTVARRGKSMM